MGSATATSAAACANKGKLTGAKSPLSTEARLVNPDQAADSKLRGCDVGALKVEDVASSGYAVDRATIRQKKTGQPVRFELTE